MLKKVKGKLEKILLLIIIFSLISVYLPVLSQISFATDDILSLNTPTNLGWREGSTATATWDAVKNANYYYVYVDLFMNGVTIDSRQTGTSNTEIDLQQELYSMVENKKDKEFCIKYKIIAAYINNGSEILSSKSDYSQEFIYKPKIGVEKLETPKNVTIDDNYNVSWTEIPNCDYYAIKFCFYKDISSNYNCTFKLIQPNEGVSENGTFKANIENLLKEAYKDKGYAGEEYFVKIQVSAIISIMSSKNIIDSDYSELSEKYVKYSNSDIIKLETPKNVTIDDDYNVSWTEIPNCDYYAIKFNFYKDIDSYYGCTFKSIQPNEGISENGIFKANIENLLKEAYKNKGYTGEEYLVKIQIAANVLVGSSKNIINSDYSELSEKYIKYSNSDIIKLETPKNVTIDDDYNVSWTEIPNCDYYAIEFNFYKDTDSYYICTFKSIQPNEGISENGIFKANIENLLKEAYKNKGYTGDVYCVKIRVSAWVYSNKNYVNSEYSDYTSKSVYYTPSGTTKINSIVLSPNKPVIAIGRTMYIGKTINPDNAYYSSIDWSTSDNSIVDINDMGQITGIAKGNAKITAKINNASQDAEVSVYEIKSNIKNIEESKEVINEANEAIEAVVTNGDITNMDITDKETVLNEIEQGAENGNMFNVDIKYNTKAETEYNNIKNSIDSKFSGYSIAGGNDIKIGISHTDVSGLEHHIANIMELKNNVTIEFKIPTNIPQLAKSKTREYKLVRCHDDKIEDIDFEIDNGMVKTSSNKFSDFILLYRDVDVPYLIGDVNGDKKVSTLDYGLILSHVMRTQKLEGEMLKRADVNGDEKVSTLDYGLVLSHVMRTALLQ